MNGNEIMPRIFEDVPTNITEEYDLLEQLGEGNFAKVRKARHNKTKKEVAVKMIDKRKIVSDRKQLISLFNEIVIMRNVQHPNIIKLLEVYETDDKLCLIMQLVTGGELFDRIAELGSYSERDASLTMLSLLRAIKYLHDKGIVHRDLKPENLLYESQDPISPIMVSDFGLSKVMNEECMMQTCCGTPSYVAPEILKRTGYGPEVDIWSLGVVLFVLLCGYPPFYDENQNALFSQILAGSFEFLSPYWDPISDLAKDLIRHMICVDPQTRYSAAQALKHPWFKVALPTYKLDQTLKKFQESKEERAKRRWKNVGLISSIVNTRKK